MDFLLVGFGGFFGAVLRYAIHLVEKKVSPMPFPLGTLFVNVLGCFVAGMLIGHAEKSIYGRTLLLFFLIGFTGAFTTFSAFSADTVHLLRGGFTVPALVNILASVTLGLVAIMSGRFLTE